MNGNVGFITQKTRYHEFGTVTNGVDGAVFHDNALVANHETFQRPNDATQVRFLESGERSVRK